MNDSNTRIGAGPARAIPVGEPSTLDRIADRILNASRSAREIGHKLHEHADALHGPAPETKGETLEGRDRASGAIERIWQALDDLDNSQAFMAEGAGRNCTLA